MQRSSTARPPAYRSTINPVISEVHGVPAEPLCGVRFIAGRSEICLRASTWWGRAEQARQAIISDGQRRRRLPCCAVPMLCVVGTAGNLVTWIISKERMGIVDLNFRAYCMQHVTAVVVHHIIPHAHS
jgi:hypothetical protein